MQKVLSVPRDFIEELEKFAVAQLPAESCALLAGLDQKVTQLLFMNNSDRSPISFNIAPHELLEAYQRIESMHLNLVGIFHSHPGSPSPSTVDIQFMEINPVVWLIYSTTEKIFRAHHFEGGRVSSIKIDILNR